MNLMLTEIKVRTALCRQTEELQLNTRAVSHRRIYSIYIVYLQRTESPQLDNDSCRESLQTIKQSE